MSFSPQTGINTNREIITGTVSLAPGTITEKKSSAKTLESAIDRLSQKSDPQSIKNRATTTTQTLLKKMTNLFKFSSNKVQEPATKPTKINQAIKDFALNLADKVDSQLHSTETNLVDQFKSFVKNNPAYKDSSEVSSFINNPNISQGVDLYKELANTSQSSKLTQTSIQKFTNLFNPNSAKVNVEKSMTKVVDTLKNDLLKDAVQSYKQNLGEAATEVHSLLDNVIEIIDSGKNIHESLHDTLKSIEENPTETLANLIKFDKKFATLKNMTNFSNKELATLEKDLGVDQEIHSLKSQYSGTEETHAGTAIVKSLVGNLPGGSTTLKMNHVDKAKDAKVNIGTEKSEIFNSLPEFSESSSILGTSLRSIGEILIKAPLREISKPITMVTDSLTGIGVGLSRMPKGGLTALKTSFKNRGLTRKTFARSVIQFTRAERNKQTEQLQTLFSKTKEKSSEQKLMSTINLKRNQLTMAKNPNEKQKLLNEMRTASNQLRQLYDTPATESLEKDVEELKTDEKKEKKSLSKEIQDAQKDLRALDGKKESSQIDKEISFVTSTTINKIRIGIANKFSNLSKGFNLLTKVAGDITGIETKYNKLSKQLDQKNKIATNVKLLDKLDEGIAKLEDKFSSEQSSNSIGDSISRLKDNPNLSSNTKQTLENLSQNPEYYDMSLIDKDVLEELKNLPIPIDSTDNVLQEDISAVTDFIDKNVTLGILRQKDDSVLACGMAHIATEHAGSAAGGHVGGHLARTLHVVIRPATKLIFQTAVNTFSNNSKAQQEILDSNVKVVSDTLHTAEKDILKDIQSSDDPNDKLLANFLSTKQKIDDALNGNISFEDAHKTISKDKEEYTKLLKELKTNKAVMSNFQKKISDKLSKLESSKEKNLCSTFETCLDANDPTGSGFADALLLPSHRTAWAIKNFSTSSL